VANQLPETWPPVIRAVLKPFLNKSSLRDKVEAEARIRDEIELLAIKLELIITQSDLDTELEAEMLSILSNAATSNAMKVKAQLDCWHEEFIQGLSTKSNQLLREVRYELREDMALLDPGPWNEIQDLLGNLNIKILTLTQKMSHQHMARIHKQWLAFQNAKKAVLASGEVPMIMNEVSA